MPRNRRWPVTVSSVGRILLSYAGFRGCRVWGFVAGIFRFPAVHADLCLPPLSTLRTASALQQRLSEICASGFCSLTSAGPPTGCWSLNDLEGDTCGTGATLPLLRQAAAVSGAAAAGAVQTALADLDVAIRNAACSVWNYPPKP